MMAKLHKFIILQMIIANYLINISSMNYNY